MKFKVIREFRRAVPGSVYGEVLVAGVETEIDDEKLAADLEREGYIAPIAAQVATPKGEPVVPTDAPTAPPEPAAPAETAAEPAAIVEPPAKPAKTGKK